MNPLLALMQANTGAIVRPLYPLGPDIYKDSVMNQYGVPQSTLIEGLIEIPALQQSNLEVLHTITANLNAEGFAIKKINIFEEPLIAYIEIENKVSEESRKSNFSFFKTTPLKTTHQKFYISLTMCDFMRSTKRQELIYSIKNTKSANNSRNDNSTMSFARRIKEKLLTNFDGIIAAS